MRLSRIAKNRTILISSLLAGVSIAAIFLVLVGARGGTVEFTYEEYIIDDLNENIEPLEQEESKDTISIIFGGDVMLARTIEPKMLRSGFDPMKNLRDLFEKQDLVAINLEYVAANSGIQNPFKGYTFRAGPHTLDYLKDVGVDVVSIANNHAGDYGYSGFLEMLKNLKNSRLGYFGGGGNASKAYAPLYVNFGEVTIGLIGVNMVETPYFAATDSQPGNAWLNETLLKKGIKKASRNADVVVVMPHWGTEYTSEINSEQTRIGKLSINAGADLVMGGHPHHVQKVQDYKDGKIFYSMGNLVFDGPGPEGWNDGYLVSVILSSTGEILTTERIFYTTNDAGKVTLK